MIKFKYIILSSAIFLASCSAVFSILGISQLFIGASIITGIMASSIELGKIVSVSALYRFWHTMPRALRTYLFGAVIVASCVTSTGIYGFLSSAYAVGSSEIKSKQNTISTLASEDSLSKRQLAQATDRLNHLQSIQSQQENRLDSLIAKNRGTATQQSIIKDNNKQMTSLQITIDSLNKHIAQLETNQTQISTDIGASGRIGAFYSVAKTLNFSLDKVVIWFILVLVLIFDPLSIALFLAYNVADSMPNVVIDSKSIDLENSDSPLEELVEDQTPYFMHADYDWKHDERWRSDPKARAYFIGLGIKPQV